VAQEDIERMRAGYEAMRRGDFNAVLDLMDPEIEIRDRPEIPDPQTYRGREGVLSALSRNFESFDDLEMVPESIVEGGDKMVVCILLRGRGRISGVPVEDRLAHLWSLRDGRAVALQVYSDPAEALRAAGLAERS
jgi:ketosteroid isomerase-like protein